MKHPLLLYRDEHFNANFYHYSNVDIDHSFLFVDEGRQVLLVPRMNLRMAKEQFGGTVIPYQDPIAELRKLAKGRQIGVDGSSMYFHLTERLRKFCRPVDVSEELCRRRMVKTMEEVGKVKKAVENAREILDSLEIKKGMSEARVREQLMVGTLERGLDISFKPIVAADRNSSFPHYRTGNAKIKGMVLVDFGVRFGYYSSDLTRCFFLGERKKEAVYLKLQEMFADIMDALPDLATGSDLAAFSKLQFKKRGLPELPHAIGHGIGLEVHEYPRLGVKSRDRLAGAAMAIEPSAYFDDFGVRFEQDIYFDGKKARVL